MGNPGRQLSARADLHSVGGKVVGPTSLVRLMLIVPLTFLKDIYVFYIAYEGRTFEYLRETIVIKVASLDR